MALSLYFQCLLAATLGGLVHASVKAKGLQTLAKKSNIEFTIKGFFKDDWITMVGNQLFIFLALLIIDEWLNVDSIFMERVKTLFAVIGFGGSSLALALFSTATKKLYSAIDYKTTIADEASGTLDQPTPSK